MADRFEGVKMIRLDGNNHVDLAEIADACPYRLEFYVDGIKQEHVKSADEVSGELVKYLHIPGSVNTLCSAGNAAVEVVMRGKVEVRPIMKQPEQPPGKQLMAKPTIIRSVALDGTVREAEVS